MLPYIDKSQACSNGYCERDESKECFQDLETQVIDCQDDY